VLNYHGDIYRLIVPISREIIGNSELLQQKLWLIRYNENCWVRKTQKYSVVIAISQDRETTLDWCLAIKRVCPWTDSQREDKGHRLRSGMFSFFDRFIPVSKKKEIEC
jgi:hypothetical protein